MHMQLHAFLHAAFVLQCLHPHLVDAQAPAEQHFAGICVGLLLAAHHTQTSEAPPATTFKAALAVSQCLPASCCGAHA
jgi:hypothetical protein